MKTNLAYHESGLDRSLCPVERIGLSDEFAQLTMLHTICTYNTHTKCVHKHHVLHTFYGCFPKILEVLERLNTTLWSCKCRLFVTDHLMRFVQGSVHNVVLGSPIQLK